MILIADSGSTTTDWCLLNTDLTINKYIKTAGLNPNYLTENEILEILFFELKQNLPHAAPEKITHVYFYGSGCSTEQKQMKIQSQIAVLTPNAEIIAEHDMTGAAISLCGSDMGIACILGTGSNVCFYDGKNIKKTILSLGYLLGDEGSGTYIGKKILYAYLKNQMPNDIRLQFISKYKKEPEDIVADMYASRKTGAYFSLFSYFASENMDNPFVQNLIQASFRDFFTEQVAFFEEAKHIPVGFVGSIALVFEQQLEIVAKELGYTLGKVIQNPIKELVQFHQKMLKKSE
ncbi:MAG: ATPase [Bacteroidales bacterium]|jgi:N-acetylglucosamine kinase-like BadF-type ATPase|nr:ATPase [Bacteroidales bacterium]